MSKRNSPPAFPDELPGSPSLEGVNEDTWMDVIQKMDQVYSQLIQDEIELESKNSELEQSQQFIQSVLSSMSDVLLVCDDHGCIEQVNAALCELVGRDPSDLQGLPLHELLADQESIAATRQAMKAAAGARQGAGVEIRLANRHGQPVPVDANCTPRLTSKGKQVGTVWVGRPTAELKRAYQALQAAHDTLKRTQQQLVHSEKMASLGQLVAGVAHELNNPISFVLGNVHALRKYGDRLQTYMAAMHANEPKHVLQSLHQQLRIEHLLADLPSLIEGTIEGAQRTSDIVKGLKRFSAMDAEERLTLNLSEVIDRAIHWVQKGTRKPITVHWGSPAAFFVSGNSGQLLQVLMNLLQNAYDALDSSEQSDRQVWVSIARTDQSVTTTVRDNGPGIPSEIITRIFDPFFSTKPAGKGTGLGLSISYGIVEQHGGRLQASNRAEGGAEFILSLPTAPPAEPTG